MHMFTERTQVLLTRDQRLRLERRAAEERRSVGALIREAVDAYVGSPTRSRAEAASRLMQLDAPVGDWEAMKQEILRGAGPSGATGTIGTTQDPAATRPRRARNPR